MQNAECIMQNECVPSGRILNHLRSKYLNYALCIMNYALFQFGARQCVKLEFSLQWVM